MPQVYKNDLVRDIPRSSIEEYLAAGWTQSAETKKSKAKAEVAAPVEQSTAADSGSPEALASVTTQAPPGDIILDKGDE